MLPDEILAQLTRVQKRVPREALAAAEEHRAELTPRLLGCLVEVVARPDLLENDPDLQLPFYAMYLLAAWREKGAHPLLLGFLRLPGDQPVDLSGDIVTQDMDRMLAQTCGGDPAGIVGLARDAKVNEWSRGAAIKALALLAGWNQLSLAALVAHYRAIVADAGPPANGEERDHSLAQVVCSALDLQLLEMRDEVLALMERGWLDESVVGKRDDVAREFERASPQPPTQPIDNVADAIRWWGCFERPTRSSTLQRPPLEDERVPLEERQPYRAPPKVGRNDPCLCGSGKKFKKCCGG